jgi:dTDP-4-dehydrorhamnose 3,5-epimerase
MKALWTALPGVVVLECEAREDERGWFMESYSERDFRAALGSLGLPAPRPFVQDNHSCSRKGVLRGLHYQLPPAPQGKLVRVARGTVFDVAVDVRCGSPTFGRWHGVELSASNRRQLWIPEGFAHGFVALEDDTHVLYKCTGFHAPECERAIAWNDAAVGIAWPELGGAPLLSAKDAAAPPLSRATCFPP